MSGAINLRYQAPHPSPTRLTPRGRPGEHHVASTEKSMLLILFVFICSRQTGPKDRSKSAFGQDSTNAACEGRPGKAHAAKKIASVWQERQGRITWGSKQKGSWAGLLCEPRARALLTAACRDQLEAGPSSFGNKNTIFN